MVVPGAIARREMRTSIGPAGMSWTMPPTRSWAKPIHLQGAVPSATLAGCRRRLLRRDRGGVVGKERGRYRACSDVKHHPPARETGGLWCNRVGGLHSVTQRVPPFARGPTWAGFGELDPGARDSSAPSSWARTTTRRPMSSPDSPHLTKSWKELDAVPLPLPRSSGCPLLPVLRGRRHQREEVSQHRSRRSRGGGMA